MTGSVLVVGGGIAGRAVARVLARGGVPCRVVEARAEAGLGMALNLPGNAVRALADLGVDARALSRGTPVRRREYRNGRGRLLFAADDQEFWGEVGLPQCVRHGHLVDALHLPGDVTLVHARALAARPDADSVEVEFEGGSRQRFSFVIAADGVHSSLRTAITPDGLQASAMADSGWRFVGPDPGVDCWTAWSARELTVVLIPLAEGLVYGYVSRTGGGDVGAEAAWLTGATQEFPSMVRLAIASAITHGEVHRSSVQEVRIDHWHHGRLTLIGDAAHATGPIWAQGAAMALEDALVLGQLLTRTREQDWSSVGAEYELLRRPRVAHVQAATDRMSRLASLPGWIRDGSARILGPASYRSAYGALRAPCI